MLHCTHFVWRTHWANAIGLAKTSLDAHSASHKAFSLTARVEELTKTITEDQDVGTVWEWSAISGVSDVLGYLRQDSIWNNLHTEGANITEQLESKKESLIALAPKLCDTSEKLVDFLKIQWPTLSDAASDNIKFNCLHLLSLLLKQHQVVFELRPTGRQVF